MSERVLSTDTAKQAISQMQTIINGGFQEQIQQLNRQGEVLSDPNNWDGPLAAQFRGSWQDTRLALNKVKEELDHLRAQVQQISDDIFRAGGGA